MLALGVTFKTTVLFYYSHRSKISYFKCLSPQKLPKNKPNCLTENKMVELPQNEKGVKKRERKHTSCDQTEKV
jgi:hypothetical protein